MKRKKNSLRIKKLGKFKQSNPNKYKKKQNKCPVHNII